MKISVIVTTYNRPDALAAVLAALLAQDDDDCEIIVADDGSAEPTRTVVEQAVARARTGSAGRRPGTAVFHAWQPDHGFRAGAARNRGLLAATGDYVVFVDGDCLVRRDFLAGHRRFAQAGCTVTGSRILLSQAFTQRVLAQHLDLPGWGLLPLLRARLAGDINRLLPALPLPDSALRVQRGPFRWRGIKTANLAAWRADCLRVNGFDETFDGWGHEDADFVLRLHHAGIRRKSGFGGPAVWHLWHREAGRTHEAGNRARVEARLSEPIIEALRGIAQAGDEAGARTQRL